VARLKLSRVSRGRIYMRDGCRVLHRRGTLRPGCWFYGVLGVYHS
jgi:hypothetical protein